MRSTSTARHNQAEPARKATRAIRKLDDPSRSAVPILAVTAFGMDGDKERCLAAGMNGFLAKPIDPDALWAAVESLASSSIS